MLDSFAPAASIWRNARIEPIENIINTSADAV